MNNQPPTGANPRIAALLGVAANVTRAGPHCVNDEQIAARISGGMSTAQTAQFDAHIAQCLDCYTHWRESAEIYQSMREDQRETSAAAVKLTVPWWQNLGERLRPIFQGPVGVWGAGLATAAIAAIAVLVMKPGHDLSAQLAALESTLDKQSQSAPLTLAMAPETTVVKTLTEAAADDLAFKAGMRNGFTRAVAWTDARTDVLLQDTLDVLNDIVPECLRGGAIQNCPESLRTQFEAGKWTAIAYTVCQSQNNNQATWDTLGSAYMDLRKALERNPSAGTLDRPLREIVAGDTPNHEEMCHAARSVLK